MKAWTHYTRNGGPSSTTIPDTVDAAAAIVGSGSEYKNTGHTEWPDGRVHHTGFTAAMTPNTFVPYPARRRNYSTRTINSWQEGKDGASGKPTYAIVTSRSYHAGIGAGGHGRRFGAIVRERYRAAGVAGSGDASRWGNRRIAQVALCCASRLNGLSQCSHAWFSRDAPAERSRSP